MTTKKTTKTPAKTDKKSGRGRPKADKKEKNSEKVAEEIVNEEVIPEKTESEVLLEKIYDNEIPNNVLDFPNSDLKTQTKTLIDKNSIFVSKLPQSIIDLTNDLINDFNIFLTNTMNVSMIPVIMEKDLKCVEVLKNWIEPRKDFIDKYNQLNPTANNLPQTINTNPTTSVQNTTSLNTPPANISVKQVEPLIRQAHSTYTHHANNMPNAGGTTTPAPNPISDNKDIYNQLLAESIKKQQKIQEDTRNGILPVKQEIDEEKYFKDYTATIINQINSTFQMIHWKYIPMDTLKNMLLGCDKKFFYEIVENGEMSYLRISNSSYNFESEKFAIK